EVHHLLGLRQGAQITVNDNAIEAVINKNQEIAEQLDEGVHGKPRDAPKSAARKEPRLRPLRRRPTPGRWCKLPPSRRDPLHPAPRRRSRWPRRHHRSTCAILQRNRRCMAHRPTTVSRSASAATATLNHSTSKKPTLPLRSTGRDTTASKAQPSSTRIATPAALQPCSVTRLTCSHRKNDRKISNMFG